MSSNIKSVLEGLSKKELVAIANQKKISIPSNWSKSLIVELLALNISIDNIPARARMRMLLLLTI